jgi:hypothetical protein
MFRVDRIRPASVPWKDEVVSILFTGFENAKSQKGREKY